MNEMNLTPEERLVALDPVAGSTYAHANPSAMLARVTAHDRVVKVSFAQGFRLRMGTAVATATLVAVGGIAALQAASPSLATLALGSPSGGVKASTSAPSTAASPSFAMRIWRNYIFVAGPNLSSSATTAPTYVVTPPSDLAGATSSIDSVFNVSGTPSDTPAPNASWNVTDSSNNQVSFSADGGALYWSYSNSTQKAVGTVVSSDTTSVPPSTVSANDAAIYSNSGTLTVAENYLSQLGVSSSDLGTPSFSNYSLGQGFGQETSVDLPWTPNGVYGGSDFYFTVDGQGNLVSASGIDATIAQGPSYPLISEVAGVAALQAQQGSYGGPVLFAPGTAAPLSTDTTTTTATSNPTGSGSSGPPSTSTTGSTPTNTTPSTVPDTIATPPTVTVTLDSVTIGYSSYTLSNGSVVWLPVYNFHGTDSDGNAVDWPTILAVDPSYVDLGSIVHPMIY